MTRFEKVASTAASSILEYTMNDDIANISDISSEREILPLRWPTLALGTFMILGAVGNALVCIAIFVDKRLQNVTNYFLFSLAAADLLVSLLVMPISILVELHHGYWRYGFLFCVMHSYVDVFLCSASIVHMTIISVDRYLGISQPLKTRNKSKFVVMLKIVAVWVITTTISCPIIVLAVTSPRDVYQDNTCAIDNPYFMIYGSTLSFLIPSLIMAATYVRTTQLLRKEIIICGNAIGSSNRSSRGGSGRTGTNDTGEGLRRTHIRRRQFANVQERQRSTFDSTDESIHGSPRPGFDSPILISNGNSRSTTNLNYAKKGGPTRKSTPIVNDASSSFSAENACNRHATGDQQISTTRFGQPLRFQSQESQETGITPCQAEDPPSVTFRTKFKERTMTLWNRTARRTTSATELANERKATRVLGLVFACFFVCWTPFFVHNFTLAFCGELCQIPRWIASVFLWLGYISSTINPIIYTVFNERFRNAFLRILSCRCHRSGDRLEQLTRGSATGSFQMAATGANYGFIAAYAYAAKYKPIDENFPPSQCQDPRANTIIQIQRHSPEQ